MCWGWKRPPRSFLVASALLLALFFLGIPPLFGFETNVASGWSVALRIGALSSAIAFFYHYHKKKNRTAFRYSHDHNQLLQLPTRSIRVLQKSAAAITFSRDEALLFSLAVTAPQAIRQRVVESYEPLQRALKQHVSIELQLPREFLPISCTAGDVEDDSRIYVPVLLPSKGKLQDNFSIVGIDGNPLHVLSYRESLRAAAAVLRLLLTSLLEGVDANFDAAVKKAELAALSHIAARRTSDGEAPELKLDVDWADGIPIVGGRERYRQSIIDFVDMLSYNYAIVAEVAFDSSGRGFVKYEQTLVPDLELSRTARLKTSLGTRPIVLSLGILNASTCQSYHLRVDGGEGLYLGDQKLLDAAATLSRNAGGGGIPPHYRFRRRLGQAYGHFYARAFPEPAELINPDNVAEKTRERPHVRFEFFETPPGSLIRAALSASACLFLVSIAGIINSRNSGVGTDSPTFLLVFPAVVAAWLGFEHPGRRLLEGTHAARLSLAVTVVTSIIASGVYTAHQALNADACLGPGSLNCARWYKLPDGWSIFYISDVSWVILFLVAAANVAVILFLYIKRTAYYTYLISRVDDGGLHAGSH